MPRKKVIKDDKDDKVVQAHRNEHEAVQDHGQLR